MWFTLMYVMSMISVSSLTPMNPCRQCKHFKRDPLNKKYGKCEKFPVLVQEDLEKPTLKTEHTYCAVARSYDHLCGPKGKYYEPK